MTVTFLAAPEIRTARLVLGPHVRADYEECLALWADPDTARFIGGVPHSPQEAWFRLLRYGGMWTMQGYGFWAVRDAASGAYLGDVGLMDAMRGISGLDDVPEVGWVLKQDAGGRGIATEAVAAILAWADEYLATARTACIIDPENLPSLRVAAKLGFVERDRPLYKEKPIILLSRPRGKA